MIPEMMQKWTKPILVQVVEMLQMLCMLEMLQMLLGWLGLGCVGLGGREGSMAGPGPRPFVGH